MPRNIATARARRRRALPHRRRSPCRAQGPHPAHRRVQPAGAHPLRRSALGVLPPGPPPSRATPDSSHAPALAGEAALTAEPRPNLDSNRYERRTGKRTRTVRSTFFQVSLAPSSSLAIVCVRVRRRGQEMTSICIRPDGPSGRPLRDPLSIVRTLAKGMEDSSSTSKLPCVAAGSRIGVERCQGAWAFGAAFFPVRARAASLGRASSTIRAPEPARRSACTGIGSASRGPLPQRA